MSKGSKVGVTLIEKYEKIISSDFDTLIKRLQARTKGVADKIERQVQEDFGVYKLYAEKAALEKRLKDVDKQIKRIEKSDYNSKSGEWENQISAECKERMNKLNEPLMEVVGIRDQLIRNIQLSGIGQEIKSTFDAIPGILEDLGKKFGSLPKITETDVKKLSEKKTLQLVNGDDD